MPQHKVSTFVFKHIGGMETYIIIYALRTDLSTLNTVPDTASELWNILFSLSFPPMFLKQVIYSMQRKHTFAVPYYSYYL